MRRPIAAASSYSGGIGDAARQRQRAIRLDDAERHEQARDGRAVVDAAERIGDPASVSGSWTASSMTGEPSMNRVTR